MGHMRLVCALEQCESCTYIFTSLSCTTGRMEFHVKHKSWTLHMLLWHEAFRLCHTSKIKTRLTFKFNSWVVALQPLPLVALTNDECCHKKSSIMISTKNIYQRVDFTPWIHVCTRCISTTCPYGSRVGSFDPISLRLRLEKVALLSMVWWTSCVTAVATWFSTPVASHW